MSSTLRSALQIQYKHGKDNVRTLQLLLRQVILVLVEIEEFFWDSLCRWLIVRIMIRLQVRVPQGLFNSDALDRVECKQLLEQVEGQVGGLWEHDFHWNLLLERQRANVLASTTRLDAVVVFHGRGTEDVKDKGQLVMI